MNNKEKIECPSCGRMFYKVTNSELCYYCDRRKEIRKACEIEEYNPIDDLANFDPDDKLYNDTPKRINFW